MGFLVAASEAPPVVNWGGLDTLAANYAPAFTGKDATITPRHLANNVSGYALPENPGDNWAYNDFGVRAEVLMLQDALGGLTTALATEATTWLAPLQLEGGGLFSSRLGGGTELSPQDYARIGWLWANRGDWNGTQIIDDSWFDIFTTVGVDGALTQSAGVVEDDYLGIGSYGGGVNQTAVGPGRYGWHLWLNGLVPGGGGARAWPDLPVDTYNIAGHGGQESMVVIPSLSIVASGFGAFGDPSQSGSGGTFNDNVKLLVDAVTGAGSVSATFPGATWTDITDAQAGLDTTGLDAYIAAVDGVGGYGIVTRHGYQVRTYGSVEPTEWSSGGKPMLAFMLGHLVEEGVIV